MTIEEMKEVASSLCDLAEDATNWHLISGNMVSASTWKATAEICERQDETNKLLRELALEIRVMNNASIPR